MGESLLTILTFLSLSNLSAAFCDLEQFFSGKQVSIEETAQKFPIVFRGISLATPASTLNLAGDGGKFTARFELLNTFKDAPDLRDHWTVRADSGNREINVTIMEKSIAECVKGITAPLEYIVFGMLYHGTIIATSMTKWNEDSDQRIWMILGWSKWSEWSPCSVSCSSGIQQRIRHCLTRKCPGYNIEQRHCNLFGCDSTINPLALEDDHYFHPTKDRWKSTSDRESAWKLESYIYLWVPSVVLLASMNLTQFPMQFSVFFTVRINNDTSGTIFSLRSRTLQDTYLSIDFRKTDIKLAHASQNTSDTLVIPISLADSHWHQIAISIRDQDVVDCFVDCQWIMTDILRSATLDLLGDTDLIIGYMFEGDLEQLSIVLNPDMANLHCSTSRIAIIDPSMEIT